MPCGFSALEVAGTAPVPKSHWYVHSAPELPVLEKFTVSFTHRSVEVPLNDAVGF